MIKKVIFDIDNTLMDFPKHYEKHFKDVLNKYSLDIKPVELYNAIGTYETSGNYIYCNKEELIKVINKELNLSLTLDFLEDFFNMYDKLITEVDKEVIKTLEYLKGKYELYIITNWFTDSQKSRLKEAGILKYFDGVYGTDIIPMKPRRECFMSVIGNLDPSECVMIGDNLEVDIKIPYEMGMQVYHLNKFGTSKYPTIRKIEELKERL